MQMAKKFRVLTLLQKEDSVIAVSRDFGVSRETIFQLKNSTVLLPPGMISKRKLGSGAPKKISPRTDKLLKHEEILYPFITAVELKKTSTMSFSTTPKSGQFVLDSRRILVYQVAVQPRNRCSNEEEKTQLLPKISTLDSCRMEKSDV